MYEPWLAYLWCKANVSYQIREGGHEGSFLSHRRPNGDDALTVTV